MKRKLTAVRVASALDHARMEVCDFGRLGHGNARPTFDDGRVVTEANVTEFIRERTGRWRRSWIIIPLEEALKELTK